jgi:predicted negative regulator of RcsB-dependent stress response
MKKTVKTILVVLVLSVLVIFGYKYFFKSKTTTFTIVNNSTDIVINATTSKSNQALTINKYFSNDFTVDR